MDETPDPSYGSSPPLPDGDGDVSLDAHHAILLFLESPGVESESDESFDSQATQPPPLPSDDEASVSESASWDSMDTQPSLDESELSQSLSPPPEIDEVPPSCSVFAPAESPVDDDASYPTETSEEPSPKLSLIHI